MGQPIDGPPLPGSQRQGTPLPCWLDGRVVARGEAKIAVEDSAFLSGMGHYTTALIRGGETVWLERHVARLQRDAARLGLDPVDGSALRRAFAELAGAAFGAGDGAIRLQHSRDARGASHLCGIPRALGDDPPEWSAIRAPFAHEGARPWSGVKITGSPLYAMARAAGARAGADEVLLADVDGRLIEGARSNIVVLLADGNLVTPDLARGGVSGMAREVLLERVPELLVRDIGFHLLANAREILAINSLRHARPITRLDERPLGCADGPARKHLEEVLAAS